MKTCLLITIFNRAHLLRLSLERLTHLTIPDEVLIVDDGSSDDCEHVVRSFEGRLPVRYIYNHNPVHSICSMARNIGVKNTDCEIIITAEPEILFVTDVVAQMLQHHQDNPDQVITAGIIYHAQKDCVVGEGFATNAQQALKDSIVQEYQIQPRSYHPSGFCKTVGLVASYIALYRKEWLLSVGGWDEEFKGIWGWDDTDLLTRLRISGINQDRANDIEAIHQYHGALPPSISGEASLINEQHMRDKRLDQAAKGDPILVANKGKDYGIIISR